MGATGTSHQLRHYVLRTRLSTVVVGGAPSIFPALGIRPDTRYSVLLLHVFTAPFVTPGLSISFARSIALSLVPSSHRQSPSRVSCCAYRPMRDHQLAVSKGAKKGFISSGHFFRHLPWWWWSSHTIRNCIIIAFRKKHANSRIERLPRTRLTCV
ncbi:hypothetical protein EX30DRAFT_228006 [Ascodesmis nigricans]|uniref:Uncharacterized protein n=1 Tax=Ascodesmis nigricans TaxID=341454 RepID=A0A4S2MJ62_9PEZI|nr:hypothetical protein EX30DRAFT_228006 [Ascodesmis nigricans]